MHQRIPGLLQLLVLAILCMPLACVKKEKIGVIYILHGGMDEYNPQFLWDASVHQFSFDQNHPVYTTIIWNSVWWPTVLTSEESVKFIRKYAFEYERIGGTDPFQKLSDKQLSDMKAALNKNTEGLKFEVEFASWMAGDRPGNYPYPRFLYNGPGGKILINAPTAAKAKLAGHGLAAIRSATILTDR